jgi:hypothetical protein
MNNEFIYSKTGEILSVTGFVVYEMDGENPYWFLGGFPKKEFQFRNYESAYDVEEMLKEKVPLPADADCDSEFCMLCIYFKSKDSALDYLKKVQDYLMGIKSLV